MSLWRLSFAIYMLSPKKKLGQSPSLSFFFAAKPFFHRLQAIEIPRILKNGLKTFTTFLFYSCQKLAVIFYFKKPSQIDQKK